MSVGVAEVEAAHQTSRRPHLQLFWHNPIACVQRIVENVNLLLVYLSVYELVVFGTFVESHIRFVAMAEEAVDERIETRVVV